MSYLIKMILFFCFIHMRFCRFFGGDSKRKNKLHSSLTPPVRQSKIHFQHEIQVSLIV